jgi:hypothetical protein
MRVPIRSAGVRLTLSAAALATAVTTGGAVGAFGAAVAPAASAATVHSTAVAKPAKPIHQVRCTRPTFKVFYGTRGHRHEKCFEGVGTINPNIPNVQLIKTGVNTGRLDLKSAHAHAFISFGPGQTILVAPGRHALLDLLTITRA